MTGSEAIELIQLMVSILNVITVVVFGILNLFKK